MSFCNGVTQSKEKSELRATPSPPAPASLSIPRWVPATTADTPLSPICKRCAVFLKRIAKRSRVPRPRPYPFLYREPFATQKLLLYRLPPIRHLTADRVYKFQLGDAIDPACHFCCLIVNSFGREALQAARPWLRVGRDEAWWVPGDANWIFSLQEHAGRAPSWPLDIRFEIFSTIGRL